MTDPTAGKGRGSALARRREALQMQCMVQRHHLVELGDDIESQLGGIDRGINIVRAVVHNPVLIAGGVSLLVFIGPRRIIGWLGRGLIFLSTARRILNVARAFRGQ